MIKLTLCELRWSSVRSVTVAGHVDIEKHIPGTTLCTAASWDSRRPWETTAWERSLHSGASTVDTWPSRVLCTVQWPASRILWYYCLCRYDFVPFITSSFVCTLFFCIFYFIVLTKLNMSTFKWWFSMQQSTTSFECRFFHAWDASRLEHRSALLAVV